MTAVIATSPKFQFSAPGVGPLINGTLTTYVAGTTTPTTTWQDRAQATANTNPIVLDGNGECLLWLDPLVTYKFVLANAEGTQQWSVDNIDGAEPAGLSQRLAASGGSALVGFIQAGTGAVPRTVQAKEREVVSVTDFGGVGDGVTDNSGAFQLAIDALPALVGGIVRFPGGGTYIMASGVTANKNLILVGDGQQTTTVKYTGSSLFIDQTAGDTLGFENIIISGSGTTAGPIAQAGSVGFEAFTNSYSEKADFIFWETVSEWQGGYYHKHINSFFRYCKYLFSGYDQNNLAFFGCSFSNFQRGIEVASGEGPITFVGGSIEYCAEKAITSSAGRAVCANLIGTYIEQGVGVACQSGITSTTGFYDNGTIIYTNGTEVYPCSFIGCTVFTPGIFSMFWTDSADGCQITGQGNNFVSRGLAPLETIYSLGGTTVRANLNDTVVGALPGGFAAYVSGLPTDLEGCTVYDPVSNEQMRPTSQGWADLTLLNGFANDGAPFANAGYFLSGGGVVSLRGTLDGTAATAAIVATLPAGYRPTNIASFSVPSVSGAGSTLQLLVYSSGAIILNGTAPFADQIALDGVSFYVNS